MYKICKRCVMDTSDPDIKFDEYGFCNHCTSAISALKNLTFSGDEAKKRLCENIDKIREEGKNNKYDCLIGLSGGVDSSYLAYKCKEWNLRPLLFHVDGGWNTPQSEHNVQAIADYLGYPLERYVVNWDEMRDLQRAFLLSGVPNQDIPQDHLFFAVLFGIAKKYNISYWLCGFNYISESILPQSWGGYAMDALHLTTIHQRFGSRELKTYPILPLEDYRRYYLKIGKQDITRIDPLNFMTYNPLAARQELTEKCSWQDYGSKHGESVFTRFFQNYFLPARFGYDKRRAHLSSLIVSQCISREQALAQLEEPLYNPRQLEEDKSAILSKLGFTEEEFASIMSLPFHKHTDYPTSIDHMTKKDKLYSQFKTFYRLTKEGNFSEIIQKVKNKF